MRRVTGTRGAIRLYCIFVLLLLLGRALAQHDEPLGVGCILAALNEARNADRVADLVGRADSLAQRGVGRVGALLVRNGAGLARNKHRSTWWGIRRTLSLGLTTLYGKALVCC